MINYDTLAELLKDALAILCMIALFYLFLMLGG
jgi:hypothetical protein